MKSSGHIHSALHRVAYASQSLKEALDEIEKVGAAIVEEATIRLSWSQKEKIKQALFSFYDTAYYHGSQQFGKYQEESVECPLEQIVKIVEEQ